MSDIKLYNMDCMDALRAMDDKQHEIQPTDRRGVLPVGGTAEAAVRASVSSGSEVAVRHRLCR